MPLPPALARILLAAALPRADRAAVLGDLHEEFAARVARSGAASARRWYWRQAATSFIPSLRRRTAGAGAVPMTAGRDRMLTALTQDVRFAFRMVRTRPFVTSVAVLSLAIGIALSAGVFGLLEAAVLRPLPVRAPHELRLVLEVRERGENHNFTHPGFVLFRAAQQSFTDVVAYSVVRASIRVDGPSEVVAGEIVSGSYFPTLGPRVREGRGVLETDMAAGAPPVVVLSAAEFRARFGNAPLDGQRVALNGTSFAVVGVASSEFRGMEVGGDTRFWAPLSAQPLFRGGENLLSQSTASWLTVMGRLREGVGDDTALAEVNTTGVVLTQAAQGIVPQFRLAPGGQGDSSLPEAVASPLQLLLGASLLVLLVACANVASLQLARAQDRSREIAVRTALGAGRGRLARLLLVEAVVLAGAGVALGLVMAQWMGPVGVAVFAALGQPVTLDVGANVPMLLFASAAGLLAAVVAGLAPIHHTWHTSATSALGDGGRTASGSRASLRWRRLLVVSQFALTLGLVATAALLVRTVVNLRAIPTGLDAGHVALLSVDPQTAGHSPVAVIQYFDRAMARLMALPGVEAVGYGRVIPVGGGGARMTIEVPGYTPQPDEEMEINYNTVSPGYFDALRIEILEGRALDDTDRADRPLAMVVNETMARRYFATTRVVGRQAKFPGGSGPALTIVGVARDVKYRTLREEPRPSFYLALAQTSRPRGGILHVRTAGDPTSHLGTLRRALGDVDTAVPVGTVRTLDEQLGRAVGAERVTMAIGISLGATAALLSAVGLFAAMATSVSRRSRELGVRLAVGATPGDVSRLVLRDGLSMAVWGSAVGVAIAIWLGTLVEHRLYGVSSVDPISLSAAVALLSAVAMVAAWAPARRAARVDPVTVLRE